ncbi:hypothetical protein A5819_000037 [Enterococcus sp. 7E2_DIV0204]|nr:hypothetical protein A5819_000037 [Enterococcus sp. 7E2_DIV0204]OTP49723.1 hypothetical protein A5884_002923 [Enterococcus sp. 7D2_DIV0200]
MNIDLVSVCVGVVSIAVIPFVTWTIKKYNNHSKYKSFKNLLRKEYVNQYTNMKHSTYGRQNTIVEKIENSIGTYVKNPNKKMRKNCCESNKNS